MRNKTGEELAGIGAMAACAFLWSLAGIFIKLIDWQPFAIAGGRSLVAAFFILLWIKKPKFTFSKAQVGAALASAGTMLLFVYANKATTSANAILLQYGAPIYVALLAAPLLGEKPRAEHWAALVAVLGGILLLFMDGLGGGSLAGNLAAVGAGVTFALYVIFMRKQKEGSPLESALLAHVLTAAVALSISLFLPAPRIEPRAVAALLGLGILQIGLASVLFAYGIKRVRAVESVLLGVIEPVLNPVWVFLATAEAPGPRAILGGGIVIAAVLACSLVSLGRDASRA